MKLSQKITEGLFDYCGIGSREGKKINYLIVISNK